MLRRVLEVALIAALLAIGVPQPGAEAMGMVSQQPGDALMLVGSEGRGRDDGARSRRDDGRGFFRHHRLDNRDRWFGFGRPYPADCGWLRRRAIETDSSYWWRRYRECRGW